MGQVSKKSKKYSKPSHPWQKERIIQEKQLIRDFGLKNKTEIWKAQSSAKRVTNQAKKVTANKHSEQAQKEKEQLLKKLEKYDLIKKGAKIEDVLDLKTEDFLGRRLQSVVFKKGLARSLRQARQFIIHGHILVNNKKVTIPSFRVTKEAESKLSFRPTSKLGKPDHPERIDVKTKKELEEKKKKSEIIKKEGEAEVKEAIEEKPQGVTANE